MAFHEEQTSNKNISKCPSKFGYPGLYALSFIFTCFLLSFAILSTYNYESPVIYVLRVDAQSIYRTTSEKFLSIALDTSILRKGWRNFDLDSTYVVGMVSSLSPAYLRFGGTAADRLIFTSQSNGKYVSEYPADGGLCAFENEGCEFYKHNITMSEMEWLKINNFTKATGLELLFDLNVLLRNGEKWDPSNTMELIKFSHDRGLNLSWQLGNEPNSFNYVFNITVSGTQLAKDFRELRRILNEIYGIHVPLVGPDVTRPRPPGYHTITYLLDFIKEAKRKGGAVIDAITWHHYYLSGPNSTPNDFVDPSNFEVFDQQAQLIMGLVSFTAPGIPVWLTETSDAYGGGAPNITDRFIGGFLWLDKLGVAAAHGIQVVARQTIFGGNYGLIDKDLKPLPDYWLSVLHKKLVGPKVLETHLYIESLSQNLSGEEEHHNIRTLRFYCHCTPSPLLSQAALTVFGLNVGAQSETVKVDGISATMDRYTYVLTGENGLQSQYTLLNGERLEMGEDGKIPALNPIKESPNSAIVLPPFSMGFWVYRGVNVSFCG